MLDDVSLKKDHQEIISHIIHRLCLTIKQWLSSIGLERYQDVRNNIEKIFLFALSLSVQISRNQVTFHLPLHRYLSILTFIALNEQNCDLKILFPISNEQFLLNMAIFPLRLQGLRYELNTNTLWSYNSYEMQIQSNMYSSTRGNLAFVYE